MTPKAALHRNLLSGETANRPAPDRFLTYSPVTGEVLGEFDAASENDALAAVDAASRAQCEWAAAGFVERRRVLLGAADLLEARAESIRSIFALETGGVAAWSAMNVHESAATLREAAGLTSSAIGTILPSADPATVNHVRRTPCGVVLAIVPWNAPLILATRSSAIALAMGNAVVLRPSESSPMTAGYILADALIEAGMPPGIVSVVTTAPGSGRNAINAMIDHPAVNRVVFIGSTAVGRRIGETAGRALVPAVLELGGKNATVVRADADLDIVAPQIAFSSFTNTGQVCMCTDRVIAHSSIAGELTERLAALATGTAVGDPRDESTELGPLINDTAAESFERFVRDAQDAGARLVAGGKREGRYAWPTVLADLPEAAAFYLEEGFSPIVSVTAVENDEEAVSLANEGEYGLIGSVFSRDTAAAQRIAEAVRAGAMHVNGPSVGDEPHVPFGGLRASGFGRLGGEESVRFFTEQRTYYLHQ